jgi:hypothetical protein
MLVPVLCATLLLEEYALLWAKEPFLRLLVTEEELAPTAIRLASATSASQELSTEDNLIRVLLEPGMTFSKIKTSEQPPPL